MKIAMIIVTTLFATSVFAQNLKLLPIQSPGEAITHEYTEKGIEVTVNVNVLCGFEVVKVILEDVSERIVLGHTSMAVLALGRHLPEFDCPTISPARIVQHKLMIWPFNAGSYSFEAVQPIIF